MRNTGLSCKWRIVAVTFVCASHRQVQSFTFVSTLPKTQVTGISGSYGVTVSVTWAVWEMPVVVPVAVIGRV
jgi:hypothetical protein